MDLMAFVNHGAQAARTDQTLAFVQKTIEQNRREWIEATLDDQCLVYMNAGESDPDRLKSAIGSIQFGMFCALYSRVPEGHPDIGVMRASVNALSAAIRAGGHITPAVVGAASPALDRARAYVSTCLPGHLMRAIKGLEDLAAQHSRATLQ